MRRNLTLIALVLTLIASEARAACGDADASGQITVLDALAVAQAAAGLAAHVTPAIWDGDVNASGTLEVLDALLIAQASAGLSVTISCAPLSSGRIYVSAMDSRFGSGILPMVRAYDRNTGAIIAERVIGPSSTAIGHLAIHPQRNLLYVTIDIMSPFSEIIAMDSRTLAEVARFGRPYLMGDLTVTADGARLVAVTIAGVAIFWPLSGALEASINLPQGGDQNSHIAAAEQTKTAWVTHGPTQSVHEIDLDLRTVIRSAPTGSMPWSVALSADESVVMVVCKGSEQLYRIDASSGAHLGITPLGNAPIGVVAHAGGRVFVSNCGSQTMQEIDQATGLTLALVPSPWKPTELAELADGTLVTINMSGGASIFDPTGVAPRLDFATPAGVDVQAR